MKHRRASATVCRSVTEGTKGSCRLHNVPQLSLSLLLLFQLLLLQQVVGVVSTGVSEGWEVDLVFKTGVTNL